MKNFRFLILAACALSPLFAASAPNSSLVIVIDGLRPDYITTSLMPNLHALGESGVVVGEHHAVFPTVTRVNSPSIATGSYPRDHGLMHNNILLPEVRPGRIDTGDVEELLEIEAATGGRLLTAVSLGEALEKAGKTLLAVSSGGTGSAYLLNHKFTGGGILNSRGLVHPESMRPRALEVLGPPPEGAYPNRKRNRWAVDAYLEIGLKEIKPDVTFMWLTDPDNTAHRHGIGHPVTDEAVRHIDDEIGRLLTTLERRGLRDRVNIFVSSDHGFSTCRGYFDADALLAEHGLDDGVTVFSRNQVFVEKGGDERIRAIIRAFQSVDWIGAIFTRAARPGSHEGFVPGTLSFDSIHYNNPRGADILIDVNWSHDVNEFGYPGIVTRDGIAGHSSSSPYDIRIKLIAAGPDIKRGLKSPVPTGNVDLAPTLCYLNEIEPPPSMVGRALTELLRDGPSADSIVVERKVRRVSTEWPGGRYELGLHTARVGDKEYIQYTRTRR